MADQSENFTQVSASRPGKGLGAVLRGLQFKWTLLLTVFMFVLAITGDTLIGRSTERLISRQQSVAALQQCGMLAAAAAPKLRNSDRVGLDQAARNLIADTSILYVEYYSSSGKLLLERRRGSATPPALGPESSSAPVVGWANRTFWYPPTEHMPLFVDVVQAATLPMSGRDALPDGAEPVVGYVRVGLDLSDIQTSLSSFLQKVRYVGICSILLIIPLAFMIVRRVAAPINELGTVVTQFAGGNYRIRSEIRRSDEIGQLATAFNSMADELAVSNNRMVKLNAELEDRVLQRTRQLKDLSERDPLTGLYNRRHLNEVLSRRFSEAERYGNDLSCMMIDLDNFKKVNDQFGHEMGDNLLILTGSVISSQMRGADVGARFGGDEFCILLPQTSAEQARGVGERIVEKFAEELQKRIPGQAAGFGISVGVAGMKELSLVGHDELIKGADQALYEAKDAGKNCIHLAQTLA
jgi:diguanylate cyclase (GGDEF)-like protein